MSKPEVVGKVDQRVIDLLGLSVAADTPILLGESNIEHMKTEHPEDFEKYFNQLTSILSAPDYIAQHPKNGSLEYIKVLDEHVLVGVRLSNNGVYFARTLFEMSPEKVERYKRNPNILKKY